MVRFKKSRVQEKGYRYKMEMRKIENIGNPQLFRCIDPYYFEGFLNDQIRLSNLLRTPEVNPALPDRIYNDNKSLWNDILNERIRANIALTLKNFQLFEWFPRSPGLYYLPEAEWAREEAMYHLTASPSERDLWEIDEANRINSEKNAYFPSAKDNSMLIFTPQGKSRMLLGGIGCIRLRDQEIPEGKVWFMSASSTPVAHGGFPLALPDSLYQKYIDQIVNQGAISCTITGHLRFLPDQLNSLFSDYPEVPQLYLLVDEIYPHSPDVNKGSHRVSVAVSFLSNYEGKSEFYASYVTFYPNVHSSLKSRTEWLENVYVKGMYQGKIVTDFDQQMRRYRGATFSLEKIMNNKLQRSEMAGFVETLQINGNVDLLIENQNKIITEKVEHMTQNRTINISQGSTIQAPVFIAEKIENCFNTINKSDINEELKKVLEQLVKNTIDLSRNSSVSMDDAEVITRDVESLSQEVTSSKPRERTTSRLIDDIKDVATKVGEIGKPILNTVAALAPLITKIFG